MIIKAHLPIYFLIVWTVLLMACKEEVQAEKSKKTKVEVNFPITESQIRVLPHAPTTITRNIKKDRDGNLLFASYEGIIRFDGKTFRNISKEANVEDVYAFDVLEDRAGNIWIASDRDGVFKYDGKSFIHFTTEHGLPHDRNMCIYEDHAGYIWVGGQGGLSRYDGINFQNFTTKEGLSNNNINCITQDRKGRIWVGTRGTLCIYDPSRSGQDDLFVEFIDEKGEPFTNVWLIYEDQAGRIWIGGQEGLCYFDGTSFVHFGIENSYAYEDSNGDFWTFGHDRVTRNYSVSHIDSADLLLEKPVISPILTRVSKEGSASGMIFCITEDKDGHMWIGTLSGVCRFDGKAFFCYQSQIDDG